MHFLRSPKYKLKFPHGMEMLVSELSGKHKKLKFVAIIGSLTEQ
jgi:hypothetical protein